MTQSQIASGIYIFYAGHDNGRNELYSLYFDGRTMGDPIACNPPGAPNLIGSPCVFYDRKGAYAGDHLPRIHIFVLAENNNIWWLSTLDGLNFITHNENLGNVSTEHRFSALLLSDGIHLYYTDAATNRIAHAWSHTDWSFQTTELLFTEQQTAAWGVAAVEGYVPYILFSNGSSQPNQPQNDLQLYYFLPGTGTNKGNGTFVANCPDQQLDIKLYDTPSAALLGDHLFVPYKSTGHGGQDAYYATMSLSQGAWSGYARVPGAETTNSFGSCVYGGRLFCVFQSSSGNSMYLQAYIGDSWLPGAIQIAGNSPRVFWGPAAVAVERGAPVP